MRSARMLKVDISTEAACEIASRGRGTPRIANSLLRRVRDFAQVKGTGNIDLSIARLSLEMLNIDQYGLDEIDTEPYDWRLCGEKKYQKYSLWATIKHYMLVLKDGYVPPRYITLETDNSAAREAEEKMRA